MELTDLEGIGPARAASLRAVGISSLRDLLYTLPIRYEDHSTVFPCDWAESGTVMVRGQFRESLKSAWIHGLNRVTGYLTDGKGTMPVCWFNVPWIARNIHAGQTVTLYGRLNVRDGRRTLQNPSLVTETGWIPVYRSIRSFPAKSFRKLIALALGQVDDCCPETLPESFRLRHQLCELNFAIRQAHFPSDTDNLQRARRRLSFENMLMYLIYVSMAGSHRKDAHPFRLEAGETDAFWRHLPFPPTGAQRRVLEEIAADLVRDSAMARLVQGDVGCGKTAVAFGAIHLAHRAGFQASMMAPTEILARQHYENAREVLEPLGIRCHLLTGSTKAAERREILRDLADGNCNAVFGTHALISAPVRFARLGLVITDEQHRFGVVQRSSLQEKGEGRDGKAPHVLVMSATPIPRTLALILYGDLDLSVIDELPAGRKPVRTRLVPENKRGDMYRFLREEVARGRQAYIVCPLVEESESSADLHSAKSVYDQLRGGELKGLKVGLTWGEQAPAEKEKTLRAFLSGQTQVLVSTTVIEVGVNNPNATIMIVENAERFGLSQLHQLRGRVGRGIAESWCFLLSDHSDKLQILCATNDGFLVSRKDLEMRGPGDLTGTRQSGEALGPMIAGDMRLLDEVTRAVQALHRDPGQADVLNTLEKQAAALFERSGLEMALS